MALTGSHRCRYCGEVLVEEVGTDELEAEPVEGGLGTANFALLVAIASTAIPVHAAISRFTPPYDVPVEMVAVGPHAVAAVLLGFSVGLLWRAPSARIVPLSIAFLFNGLAFVQMSSWRAMVMPIDVDLLPLGCMVGLVAGMSALLGRSVAAFTRTGVDSSDEAIATPAG